MQENDNPKKLVLDTNLKAYFYNELLALNEKSLCPIPESILFYSSDVLDKFSYSHNYFEYKEGKTREKILGLKLLEATQLSREEQKRTYLEVAETSLVLCGYFSESVNKKMIDLQYYSQIGKMAYGQLNHLIPSFLDIPSFYAMVSTRFELTVSLISVFASKTKVPSTSFFERVLKSEEITDTDLLVSGIHPNRSTKAS